MKKRKYRVTHTPPSSPLTPCDSIIVEGEARSAYHACKLAFRVMIRDGYIKQAPLFDQENDEFPNTTVEILPLQEIHETHEAYDE